MAQRGVEISYEGIRAGCEKLGRQYAKTIRRQRGTMVDTWHVDEVYLKINGQQKYLWRAVDQDGQVLDILVQGKHNKLAAERDNCLLKPIVLASRETWQPLAVKPSFIGEIRIPLKWQKGKTREAAIVARSATVHNMTESTEENN